LNQNKTAGYLVVKRFVHMHERRKDVKEGKHLNGSSHEKVILISRGSAERYDLHTSLVMADLAAAAW
jgi:hypothetical protein